MKLKQLRTLPLTLPLVIALVFPVLADAQIYKWKDKNGVTRYSDTRPTDTLKVDEIGKASAAKPKAATAEPTAKSVEKPTKSVEQEADPDEAARIRAEKAEQEKKEKENKAEQEKNRADNCRGAKANYKTFAQGGWIYEMDENGERQYFDDAGLDAGKAQAESEMRQYCN
jgi:outer membrane biosynthesis protein TonB